MAAAVLHDLGRIDELPARFGQHAQLPVLQRWLQQATSHQAHTTSLGRLFDAAAGLLKGILLSILLVFVMVVFLPKDARFHGGYHRPSESLLPALWRTGYETSYP